MKFFLILISIIFTVCSCTNNENSKHEYSFENDVYFQDDYRRAFNKIDNSPINGVVTQKNKNGKKIIEWPYHNGVLDGYARIWSDSILEFESFYKEGIENGIWRGWWDKENLSYEESYKNGKNDGVWKGWYENNSLRFEESYKEGARIGLFRGWHENGQLAYEVKFKDGLEDGIGKSYHENGELEREVTCKEGKEEGILQVFFPSGKIKAKYSFKEGKKNGTCLNYYENGQIRTKFNYLNGDPNGLCQSFFENGKLRGEGNYSKNEPINIKVYDDLNNLIYSLSNGKCFILDKVPDYTKISDFDTGHGFFGDYLKEDFLFNPWPYDRISGHSLNTWILIQTQLEYYKSLSKDQKKVEKKKKI